MGKFRSVVKSVQKIDKETGQMISGKTVWIPENEAAKAHPVVQEAIDSGDYEPKKGESVAEMQAKLKAREIEAANKGQRS